MSQKTKDAFDEVRKWIVLICGLICAGGGSFVLYSFRAEVRTLVREEQKGYVTTAEFAADKAATKELQLSESRNTSGQITRIESDVKELKADVKELKNYFMPAKRHGLGFEFNPLNSTNAFVNR